MKPLRPSRTERELTGILNLMGIATPPQPETRLYALLPDPVDSAMVKAFIPRRLRTRPDLPVAVSASISKKLLHKRPRKSPVVFLKARPDWRLSLNKMIDLYDSGKLRFFANGILCPDGWCGLPRG